MRCCPPQHSHLLNPCRNMQNSKQTLAECDAWAAKYTADVQWRYITLLKAGLVSKTCRDGECRSPSTMVWQAAIAVLSLAFQAMGQQWHFHFDLIPCAWLTNANDEFVPTYHWLSFDRVQQSIKGLLNPLSEGLACLVKLRLCRVPFLAVISPPALPCPMCPSFAPSPFLFTACLLVVCLLAFLRM